METKYWAIDANRDASHFDIQEAAQMLAAGKTIAFPTETVYGLGADARSTSAVERIFEAKGRPSDNPLIVHIARREQLDGLVLDVPETAQRLMDRFWPGPLTLVLPVRPGAVSPKVTAGLSTVAVRMPSHPLALALIAAAGCPVAAPSANLSGRPSPTLAAHVKEDLDGRIDGIVDGGATGVGLESTVVELDGERVIVLRPGGVTVAELQEAAAYVTLDPAIAAAERSAAAVAAAQHSGVAAAAAADSRSAAGQGAAANAPGAGAMASTDTAGAAPESPLPYVGDCAVVESPPSYAGDHAAPEAELPLSGDHVAPEAQLPSAAASAAPRSPGMKYTHYAPKGELTVVKGDDPQQVVRWIQHRLEEAGQRGETTGVLTFEEHALYYRADLVVPCGSVRNLTAMAHGLYAALRTFDDRGITYILAEACPEDGIGLAVMNRLRKAAGNRIELV